MRDAHVPSSIAFQVCNLPRAIRAPHRLGDLHGLMGQWLAVVLHDEIECLTTYRSLEWVTGTSSTP